MRNTGEFTCQAGITSGTRGLEALRRFKSNIRMEMLGGQRGKKKEILYWEDRALGVFLSENVEIHWHINQSPDQFPNFSKKLPLGPYWFENKNDKLICYIY